LGELIVAVAEPRVFEEEELNLLAGLADLAAIAVHTSKLLQGERQIAVLEERQRLAREMHDSLAQVLGYLNLTSQTALRKLDVNDVHGAGEQLREMSGIASEAYADVREAILGLREGVPARGSFVACLQEYLDKFTRQAGVAVLLEADQEHAICLGSEAEVQLLRVIQEALTNVRKHARAREAHVSISRQGKEAAIVVKDNGRGFDTKLLRQPDGATFGLRTMQERVERAGGRFKIDSAPNKGTSVRIFFPLNGGSPS
jgi:signal transduction histidine kinase